MEPWQSWGIITIAGAAAYLYYSRSKIVKRGRGQIPSITDKSQTYDSKLRDNSKGQRKRTKNPDASDKGISDTAEVSAASVPTNEKGLKKRKGGKKPGGQLPQSSAVDVGPTVAQPVNSEGAMDRDVDNVEFAKQLSGLKTGTSLNKPSTVAEPRKTKKSGKREDAPPVPGNGVNLAANGPLNPKGVSTASSTTGADADDDLSPAVSPEFGATRTPTTAGDISDMLQVPTKGPSVLRLTEPTGPQETRQPRPPKPIQEKETKKQRQNKKKNEEKKIAREEDEKERRVRLEKQLRTAREAEGRPAKNGLGSSHAPVDNAWDKSSGEGPRQPSNLSGHNDTLLDTFDHTTDIASKVNGGNGNLAGDKAWKGELPSEEEQMRLLTELDGDNGWNTVKKTNKLKKKTGDVGGRGSGNDDKGSSGEGNNSAAQWKPALGANGATRGENQGESTNSTTSDSGVDVSQPEGYSSRNPNPSPVKKPMADPKVWNRENIHNHPDYDSRYPWALIGHPEDSDWAVV